MLHELVRLLRGGTVPAAGGQGGSLGTSAIRHGSLQELHGLRAEAGGTGGCFS